MSEKANHRAAVTTRRGNFGAVEADSAKAAIGKGKGESAVKSAKTSTKKGDN